MEDYELERLMQLIINIFNCADPSGRGSAVTYLYEAKAILDKVLIPDHVLTETGFSCVSLFTVQISQ